MKSTIFNTESKDKQLVFGLDLGTTNSVVTAKISDGLPKILKSKSGETTPSCVMFNEDGTYTIGRPAYAVRAQDNVVYSFKRYMGTSTELIKTNDGSYKSVTAGEVASIFVAELMKEVKELNPEFANYNAIQVSVPAYFDINQIEDTKNAIERAGYTVVGVNDEPTAAAIVYQQIKRVSGNVLIFDLGGGTFDGVLVRSVPGIPEDSRKFYNALGVDLPNTESVLEILDVSGDNQLGGDDIDRYAVDLFKKYYELEVTQQQYEKLLLVAENVKKYGSPLPTEFIGKDFKWSFIKDATDHVVDRCLEIVSEMFKRTKAVDINCVLCGGSTKSEVLKKRLGDLFTLSTDLDPDLAVGVGNSIKYYLSLDNKQLSVINRLAKGVGVLAGGKIKFLAEKGTIIPLRSKFVARNATPFSDVVTVDLYQGERLGEKPVKVTQLTLDNLEGHNSEGYVDIIIELTITSDSEIQVEVVSGKARVKSKLTLDDSLELSTQDAEIHKDAKFYHKFKSSAEHYNNAELTKLVSNYRETGDRKLAKEIMTMLSSLADD